MSSPKISIIVATYQAETCLEQCLASIFSQRNSAYEIIVVDGGSTDNTLKIIQAHSHRIHHWESGPDAGIYDAWNKALPHVTGDWIYFLGADDRLASPDALERASRSLATAFPKYRVVYGSVQMVTPHGQPEEICGEPWESSGRKFRRSMTIPHQGAFHHRELFDVRGNFDISFRIAGDYEFLLREVKSHPALFIPNLIIANMTKGGVSFQSIKTLKEIRRAKILHGESLLSAYFHYYNEVAFLYAVKWGGRIRRNLGIKKYGYR